MKRESVRGRRREHGKIHELQPAGPNTWISADSITLQSISNW